MRILQRWFAGASQAPAPVEGASAREEPACPAAPDDFDLRVAAAHERHGRGDVEGAIEAYREASALRPPVAELEHTIGSLLGQLGRLDEAQTHLEAAVALAPNHVPAHLDLALVHRSAGRLDAAVQVCDQIVAAVPDDPAVHRALAHLQHARGEGERAQHHLAQLRAHGMLNAEDWYLAGNLAAGIGADDVLAAEHYRAALALEPKLAQAHHNLGVVLQRLGRDEEALAAHRQAAAHVPDFADAHYSSGMLELRAGRPETAVACFERALEVLPEFLAAERYRALALSAAGHPEAGKAALREMVRRDPELAEVHFDIGNLERAAGNRAAAEESFRAAVAADEEYVEGFVNLGVVLADQGRLEEAAQTLERAVALDENRVEAYNNLGGVVQSQARIDDALEHYRHAVSLDPDALSARSNLISCLNYAEDGDPAQILREHQAWCAAYWRRYPPPAGPLSTYPNSLQPGRRLRLGYLSPDFRTHSVAYFLDPILRGHDPSVVELVGFSCVTAPDAVTARMRGQFAQWHELADLDDAEAARRIHEAQIDVLIDLAGHTRGGRPGILARAPAPVQMTYLGYPNTTGVNTVGYRITDAVADPPGLTDPYYVESLVRVPGGFLSYAPPPLEGDAALHSTIDKSPPSSPLTFASFNELVKLSPTVVTTWSEILAGVPDSTLILKAAGLGDPGTRARVEQRFAAAGIEPGRLRLLGRTPDLESHLALYNEVDVALDTFPYNGTTTTCEALWMGTPVVTLSGRVHASRVGETLLNAVGRTEWVAHDVKGYVARARDLASDREGLRSLSGRLRAELTSAPAFAPGRMAGAIEAAVRAAWSQWCASVSG